MPVVYKKNYNNNVLVVWKKNELRNILILIKASTYVKLIMVAEKKKIISPFKKTKWNMNEMMKKRYYSSQNVYGDSKKNYEQKTPNLDIAWSSILRIKD